MSQEGLRPFVVWAILPRVRPSSFATFCVASTIGISAFAQAPAAAPPAQNDNKGEARRHYDHCLELFNSEAYDAALVECEKAYQLAPSYKILYNVGLIDRELNDFASALKTFERYLAEGGADVPDARRAEVDKYVGQLKGLVANIDIRVNVAGADVTIDDVPVGKAPLGRIRVNPGHRKITASRDGYAPVTKVVNISVGESSDITLELAGANAANKGGVIEPPPESSGTNPWKTPAIASWTITAALGIGAGATGFVALDKSNKLSDARSAGPNQQDSLNSQSKDVKTFSILSDVFLGATVVGAGISTWLTVKAATWKGPGGPEENPETSPSVSFGVTPFGVVSHGRF